MGLIDGKCKSRLALMLPILCFKKLPRLVALSQVRFETEHKDKESDFTLGNFLCFAISNFAPSPKFQGLNFNTQPSNFLFSNESVMTNSLSSLLTLFLNYFD